MTTKAKYDKGTAVTTVSALSNPFSTGGEVSILNIVFRQHFYWRYWWKDFLLC